MHGQALLPQEPFFVSTSPRKTWAGFILLGFAGLGIGTLVILHYAGIYELSSWRSNDSTFYPIIAGLIAAGSLYYSAKILPIARAGKRPVISIDKDGINIHETLKSYVQIKWDKIADIEFVKGTRFQVSYLKILTNQPVNVVQPQGIVRTIKTLPSGFELRTLLLDVNPKQVLEQIKVQAT